MSVVAAVFRSESRVAWRRIFLILSAAAAVVVWVTFTSGRGNPTDAFDFWVDPARPYAEEGIHDFAYSPAFAQAIAPFHLVGFDAYVAAARAAELACALLLAGPALLFALFLQPVATEINAANINLILVAAIAFGFRWPALWAIVLLTKPTMGIGLLWFVIRREWRPLAIALGTTLAIAAVSFLINPTAWVDYIRAVAQISPTPGWPFPWPVWVRLPVALPLVVWGARSSRPWAVALGAMLAAPRLYFLSPVMLLGLLPLLPNAGFARRLRSGWVKAEATMSGPAVDSRKPVLGT